MPYTPEQFLKSINGAMFAPEARFPTYTSRGGRGFLDPPAWSDAKQAAFEQLEKDYDAAIRAQGEIGNVEYLEFGRVKNKALRDRLRNELAEIMDMPGTIVEQGTGALLDGGGGRPYYFDTVNPNRPIDPMVVLWEQVTKQYSGPVLGTNVATAELISPSGRVVRPSVVQRIIDQTSGAVPLPSRWATFDIETTGLNAAGEDIWQIAIRGSDMDDPINMYFDFSRPGTTRYGTLRDTFLEGAEISDPADIKKALRTLSEYPALVGQNVSFDIGFLIDNLSADETLMADREFADLIGNLRARAAGPEVYDTAQLARRFLPGMNVADELARLSHARVGRATPYSMENIILETNLLEIMEQKYGVAVDEMYDLLTNGRQSGLHYAHVDTFFEDYFARELFELMRGSDDPAALKLAYKRGGFQLASISAEDNAMLRGLILEKHALTSYTQMGYDQVDDAVRVALQESTDAAYYFKEVDIGRLGSMPAVTLTPAEHEIILDRLNGPLGDSSGLLPDIDMARALRAHRDVMGTPDVPPDLAARQVLGNLNIPYANLSPVERRLSDSLRKTLPHSANIDALMPTGMFHGTSEVKVVGKSHRLVLPMEVLRKAEEAGVFDIPEEITKDKAGNITGVSRASKGVRTNLAAGEELFYLSPFQFDSPSQIEPVRDVAANFRFAVDEDQAAIEAVRLREFLIDNAEELGIVDRELQKIINDLDPSRLHRYGVQIGSALEHLGDSRYGGIDTARTFHDALVAAQGGVAVDFTDANSLDFAVAVAREEGDKVYSSAVVSPKGLSGRVREKFFADVRRSEELIENTRAVRSSPPLLDAIESSSRTGQASGVFKAREVLQSFGEKYRANKMTVRAAVAASAVAAGYYMYEKRKRRNEYFTDPFEIQPIEEEGFYQDYQTTLHVGIADQYNRTRNPHPLTTAGTVQELHSRKTGHTRMGNSKNAHLFGGSY